MKKPIAFLVCCLLAASIVSAANKYWVGPMNSNWNNPSNWSLTSGGAGGANVPDFTDVVEITGGTFNIKMDASPYVYAINIRSANVAFIASIPTMIVIIGSLEISPFGSLKNITDANVPFDVYFKTGATANIFGTWSFEGNVPLSGPGNPGASFIAPPGTLVTVGWLPMLNSGGQIVCKANSKPIISTSATLKFQNYTYFIADNLPDVTIPHANWAPASYNSSPISAATIRIFGNLAHLTYAGGIPDYGNMEINLPLLRNDISLALPNGSKISGNLTINNTNNHILTLLDNTSASSIVQVEIGNTRSGNELTGDIRITGNSTKVSLARATFSAPSTSFTLLLHGNFVQSAGNFSLQDYDLATGESTLAIKSNLTQTGGTFLTNSTSTSTTAKFRVIMAAPDFYSGPSGIFYSQRWIDMSSGTIDNGRNMVILQINHDFNSNPVTNGNGVYLKRPLTVGRLELKQTPLTTSASNILTVSDPSPDAISGGSSTSYVDGPLIRATNSTQPYYFPTGKGNIVGSSYFNSSVVIPVSNTASRYQAEYYHTVMPATNIYQTGVSKSEYWNINRLMGSDAVIQLNLNTPLVVFSIYPYYGVALAYSNVSNVVWTNASGSVLQPASATGTLQSRVMSMFGYFTFMYAESPRKPIIVKPYLQSANIVGSATITQDHETNNSLIAGSKTMADPVIYPNPFVDNFTMDFYYDGNKAMKASIEIYDLKGRLVYKQTLDKLATGLNHVKINLGEKKLPAAIYNAKLNINGMPAKTVKMVKVK